MQAGIDVHNAPKPTSPLEQEFLKYQSKYFKTKAVTPKSLEEQWSEMFSESAAASSAGLFAKTNSVPSPEKALMTSVGIKWGKF